jgi:hypothetical protein
VVEMKDEDRKNRDGAQAVDGRSVLKGGHGGRRKTTRHKTQEKRR